MKKHFLWAMALVLCLSFPAWALAESNMVLNGDFEQRNAAGDPEHWMHDMWLTGSDVTVLRSVEPGASGEGHAIQVRNIKANDARYVQEIAVEPDTCYRISCVIKAEGCDETEAGASIAIKDTFVSSDYVYDTHGQWLPVTLCGITGPDQKSITLMARLGDYGSLTTGAAWFDDFHMEKVEDQVLDEIVESFATLPPSGGEEQEASSGGFIGWISGLFDGYGQVTMILLGGALFAALCALLAWLVGRGRIDLNPLEGNGWRTLGWILGIALLARLVLAFAVRGYGNDMTCFQAWSRRLYEGGLSGFYAKDYFSDYPPGYMYVLYALGWLTDLLRVPYDSNLNWLLVKLPAILMDIAAAALLFQLARKQLGKTWALLLAFVYALNPAAVLNSAAWGQIDSVLALLLTLSIYLAMEDKWHLSLPVFGLAVLVKPQALMFAPLGLWALVLMIMRSEKPLRALRKSLLYIVITLAMMLLLCLPFISSLDPGLTEEMRGLPGWLKPLGFLVSLYGGTLSGYPRITVNACNLFTLLDMNWVTIEEARLQSIIGWVMMGLSYVFTGYTYFKANNIRKLPLLAATLLSLVFCLGPMMHERYLFPALLLLLLAYIEDMDVRILIGFGALSFTQFVNAALVLRSEHLQASEQIINAGVSLLNLITAALLCWTAWDLCVRQHTIGITRVYQPADAKLKAEREVRLSRFADSIFRPRDYRLNLRLKDWALIVVITALYALVAFSNLGVTKSPESTWTSSAEGEQITIDLGEVQQFHLAYYGSISNEYFKVQISEDGEAWSKEYCAEYHNGLIFRWLWYEPAVRDPDAADGFTALDKSYIPKHPLITARYVRLTMSDSGLILNEIAFVDADGKPLPITALHVSGSDPDAKSSTAALFDEQDTVPEYPSYLNGTYFDEIYHARAAYENLNGLHTYEYTHPPLGKLLIALGIKLFGMNPFGWRFMGTLFGVLMVPLMYLLAKQLFKRTNLAAIASFLMAVDCMHFTQTRIATIDSFAVFFIMLMYLFMFRYVQMSFYHAKLWRTLIPLALCGLTMGCAIATKWIGIYAAVGLAVLLFISLGVRYREHRYVKRHMDEIDAGRRRLAMRVSKLFTRNTLITLAWCLVFFVALPLLIYYYSYYWQMIPDNAFNVKSVWNMQQTMLRYHAGLGGDTHLFRSPWYQWPVIAWPMWYYTGTEYMREGYISSISCMGNPVVFWGGLVAMIFVLVRTFTSARGDRRYWMLSIGFLSQYLPWVLVPRSTFIYHYFASVPFIILATALMLDWVRKKSLFAFKATSIPYCVLALLMFGFFYPIISGTPIPRWYAESMSWFNWINFN